MGGYVKRCLGLNLHAKIENPRGQRIQELFVGGERLQPDGVYRAAFVTSKGVLAAYGTNREHLDTLAIETLRRCLQAHDPVEAGLLGPVVVV